MKDDTYSEAETERRREATIKRMLATPHMPHAKSKKTASRVKPATMKPRKSTGK